MPSLSNFFAPFSRRRAPFLAAFMLLGLAFFPSSEAARRAKARPQNFACDPSAQPFRGYSFLYPDIVNRRAAYAPFFLRFGDLYAPFFRRDLQQEENIAEWNERFCQRAPAADVAEVVYETSISTLRELLDVARDSSGKTPLPADLDGNRFALTLASNGCSEAIEYLIFAKKCQPHVSGRSGWDIRDRDFGAMQTLIGTGKRQFSNCRSHFFRLRYAYQIVRLAHYAGEWQQAVDLYNELLPQVDRRRPSIVFYWTLGHLAGALQRLGKRAEAAYRFSLVFQNCPSKRAAAWRSFSIKNDAEWAAALRLCQSDSEKATLFAMRAGGANGAAASDMEAIYDLDPKHPVLDLLLVSAVQQLEKSLLRTPATDKKHGLAFGAMRRESALKHLAALQNFAQRALREREIEEPKLWASMSAYLYVLADKLPEATYHLNRAESQLDPSDEHSSDPALKKQIDIWRVLVQVLSINPLDPGPAAMDVRGLDVFKDFPGFEDFLKDYLSDSYAATGHSGKAFLANYDLRQLSLNPSLPMLDDLLAAAAEQRKDGIEFEMTRDSTFGDFSSQVLEIKGTHLFSIGRPEAALATFREIPATDAARHRRFSPFKFFINDCLGCKIADPKPLTRGEILERLAKLEFEAKAAEGMAKLNEAADKYLLIGQALYNMSWFGYEWEAFDDFRDPENWHRLSSGPVFPFPSAPDGNRENLDLARALAMLDEALRLSRDPEISAKAAFVAAKCRQAQWFCDPACRYRPGARQIPVLPETHRVYHNLLLRKYAQTSFGSEVVKECKWFAAYARRQ